MLQHLEATLKRVVYGQDEAIDGAGLGDQARPRGPARSREADRLLSVLRPDRRRQDRGGAPARLRPRRRADPLRHVGIYGAPHGLAADRRASRLCRLRPGRPADRRHRPASALRAAARRDREGASGPVQHPVAGHGPRQADRPQRQADRLPQRDPDHDDQCGRRRHGRARRSASTSRSARATTRRRSTGCSRRNSATGSTRSCRSAGCRRRSIAQVVDKFILQLEAQLADRNVTIELTDEARDWLVENGYDEAMGARPMARVIQAQIKTPLADEVLFGRLKNGGAVRVVVTGRRQAARRSSASSIPRGRRSRGSSVNWSSPIASAASSSSRSASRTRPPIPMTTRPKRRRRASRRRPDLGGS